MNWIDLFVAATSLVATSAVAAMAYRWLGHVIENRVDEREERQSNARIEARHRHRLERAEKLETVVSILIADKSMGETLRDKLNDEFPRARRDGSRGRRGRGVVGAERAPPSKEEVMPRPGTRAAVKEAMLVQRFATITEWFDRHAIVSHTDKSALFRRLREEPSDKYGRWNGFYWFEVTMVAGNMLLVHGDIEHVLFAYHACKSLDDALNWLGQTALGDPYVYEKACIGMRLRMVPHDRVHVAHAAIKTARALRWARQCPEREGQYPCCLQDGHKGPHVAREDPTLGEPR